MIPLYRKNQGNIKSHRTEVLLNNFVDKDVQSMILPLNVLQTMLFCPKYSIKDNFITSNSRLSNFVSVSGTILFLTIISCDFCTAVTNSWFSIKTVLMSLLGRYIFVSVGVLMNVTLSLIHTNENVSFVLLFQDIHRIFNNEISFRRFVIINWLAIIFLVGCYVIAIATLCALLTFPILFIASGSILVSFDSNIIYATRVIQLLKNKVDLWNIRALQYQSRDRMETENHCKIMFKAYVDLLECYDIYRVLFQHMVRD